MNYKYLIIAVCVVVGIALAGVDLAFDQGRMVTSLRYDNAVTSSVCGDATHVVRFDAKAANVGTQDFDPITGKFEYFEAKVFDLNGNEKTSNTKEMFCPMDYKIQLSSWIEPKSIEKFGCGDYGISPGWADIYVAGMNCNWANFDGTIVNNDYSIYARLNPDGSWLTETPSEDSYDNNEIWITGRYQTLNSTREFKAYEDYSITSQFLNNKKLYYGVKKMESGQGKITLTSGSDYTLQSGGSAVLGLMAGQIKLTNSGTEKSIFKINGNKIKIRVLGIAEY